MGTLKIIMHLIKLHKLRRYDKRLQKLTKKRKDIKETARITQRKYEVLHDEIQEYYKLTKNSQDS